MVSHDNGSALNVVMLGPPGAGKGTQAERFARAHGVPKISTGDILREAVQSRSELGLQAQAAMAAGTLVSDEVMTGIVRDRLDREDARRGFVLDGFPRTVYQATELDRIVHAPLVVIEIAVPDEVLVRRLAARRICSTCGLTAAVDRIDTCHRCAGALVTRADDQVEVVRERLKVYQRQTKPLVDYYSARPAFKSVDGNQMPDAVAAQVEAAVMDVTRSVAL